MLCEFSLVYVLISFILLLVQDEDFYGFSAEDLGLKAYRSFSVKNYRESLHRSLPRRNGGILASRPTGRPRGRPRKYPLVPGTGSPKQASRKRADVCTTPSNNIYAKQYKSRVSYERRYSPQYARLSIASSNVNVKSTSEVRAKFVPRVQKPTHIVALGHKHELVPSKPNLFSSNVKRKPVSVAKQLLARAKEGKRRRYQRRLVNKEVGGEVRSRSGRVVKAKKLDYDDLTSPKFEKKKVEQSVKVEPLKRTLQDGHFPPCKIMRSAEVKLEKLDLEGQMTFFSEHDGKYFIQIR